MDIVKELNRIAATLERTAYRNVKQALPFDEVVKYLEKSIPALKNPKKTRWADSGGYFYQIERTDYAFSDKRNPTKVDHIEAHGVVVFPPSHSDGVAVVPAVMSRGQAFSMPEPNDLGHVNLVGIDERTYSAKYKKVEAIVKKSRRAIIAFEREEMVGDVKKNVSFAKQWYQRWSKGKARWGKFNVTPIVDKWETKDGKEVEVGVALNTANVRKALAGKAPFFLQEENFKLVWRNKETGEVFSESGYDSLFNITRAFPQVADKLYKALREFNQNVLEWLEGLGEKPLVFNTSLINSLKQRTLL